MYSVLRRILSGALIALMMTGMVFQAAAAEAQASMEETSAEAVETANPEPFADETAAEASAAPEPEAVEPQAEATAQPEVTGEPATDETTDETSLVEIPDEQVPLAGGQEPSVSVRASQDISAIEIGDSLVLTCELSGFDGLNYAIRWQARVNGEWRDLSGENSDSLVIKVTSENADWAYRAAVDAQPV